MCRRLGLIGFVIILSACRNQVDLESSLSATPFRVLSGVALGMTAAELQEVRAAAMFSPYRGYRETIDGMDVAYDFETGAADKASIDQRAQLERIMLSRLAQSENEARRRWRAAVDSVIAAYGPPSRCEEIRGASAGVRAIWQVDGAFLQVAARQPLDTGSEVVPNRVVFVVTSKEQPNDLMDVVRVDCPRAEGH